MRETGFLRNGMSTRGDVFGSSFGDVCESESIFYAEEDNDFS